jgi:hypothetical protein
MQWQLKWLLAILMCLVLGINIGCEAEMNESDFKKWGLKSVKLIKELELTAEPHTEQIKYLCKKTSSKFEFRLYYELVEFENSTTVKDNAEEKILKSLVDFSFELYDLKTKQKLASYKVINSSFRDNHSFIYNKPISIWLADQLKVQRNKEYEIILTLPSKRQTDSKFLKPILVGGIGADIFL